MQCAQVEKKRNYAMDVLRIISMLMIISLHFFTYNPALDDVAVFSASGILIRILRSISAISVNCYILITGYFLMKSRFSLKKIFRLVAEVWIYSVFIYCLLVLEGSVNLSIMDMIRVLTPSLTREYWFVTSYLGAYLFSPLLRIILTSLDKKLHAAMVIVGFFLFVVYYNIFFFCDNLNFGGSTGIVWFIYLYICGSYIYRFDTSEVKSNIRNYILCAVISLGSQLPFLLVYKVSGKSIFLQGSTIFDSVYNSVFVFLSSILFFKIFTSVKLELNSFFARKIVRFLTKGSFAVYLIHDNKYMRNYLWGHLALNVSDNPLIFVLYWLLTIILIYILCSIIDVLRQKLENLFFDKVDSMIEQLESKLKRMFWIAAERI